MAALPEQYVSPFFPVAEPPKRQSATILPLPLADERLDFEHAHTQRLAPARGLLLGLWIVLGMLAWEFFT